MASSVRNNHSFLQSALHRYLLATGICILLHIPFLLFRNTSDAIAPKEVKSIFPPIVCMRSSQDESLAPLEKEYYVWADISAPTQLVKPNRKHGFTAFGFPKTERFEEQFQPVSFPFLYLPTPQLAEIVLSFPGFDISDAIYDTWNNVTVIQPAARTILPVADGVTWRFESGAMLKNAPVITEQELSICRRSAGITQAFNAMTAVETIQDGPIAIPRVLVRTSCGQASFDYLALNAVRKLMLTSASATQEGTSQQTTLGSGNCTLMVLWHLRPQEKQ